MPSHEDAAPDVVTVAEATLAGLIGGTPAAVTVIVDGRVVYANEAAERLLGRPAGGLTGRAVMNFVHPGNAEHVRRRLLFASRTESAAIAGSFEMDLTGVDGAAVRVESLVHAVSWGDQKGVGLISCDVTARGQRERQLAHAATHDSLTGLPNRALLLDRLELSMARIGRSCAAVLVMLLDLDQFKTVNDTYGHSAGDQVLRDVARRLGQAMRGTDTVARLAGDEFVVCADLTDQHPDGAAVRSRVEAAMSTAFRIDDLTVALSAGIGSVVITEQRDPLDVLADVDERMYEQKRLAASRRSVLPTAVADHDEGDKSRPASGPPAGGALR
jgi:diguanylate cyclase (GGDEF)-like protein/PAS domain S-box-containing protein